LPYCAQNGEEVKNPWGEILFEARAVAFLKFRKLVGRVGRESANESWQVSESVSATIGPPSSRSEIVAGPLVDENGIVQLQRISTDGEVPAPTQKI
jgi:hypothetical protein